MSTLSELARPHAPSPSSEQIALIDELEGATAVAAIIRERIDYPLTPQAVSMWKRRGIPFRYRPILARAAGERGIAVPPDFLVGEAAKPADDAGSDGPLQGAA